MLRGLRLLHRIALTDLIFKGHIVLDLHEVSDGKLWLAQPVVIKLTIFGLPDTSGQGGQVLIL